MIVIVGGWWVLVGRKKTGDTWWDHRDQLWCSVFTQIKCDSWLSSLHHRSPFIQMKTGAQFLFSFSPSPFSVPTFSGKLFIMSTKAFLVMKWSWSLYFLALYFVGKGSVPPRETVLTPAIPAHQPTPLPLPSTGFNLSWWNLELSSFYLYYLIKLSSSL